MDPETFGRFVTESGWIVLIVYFMIERVWPWMTNSLFPQRVDAEREWMRQQVAAYEQIAKAMGEISVSNAMINERLNQVIVMQQRHDTFVVESITNMRERVAHETSDKKKAAG